MKTCLIIGAGQIGSRHLQGLVKYKDKIVVHVFDPSLDSLKVSKSRESEITHNHTVIYTTDWESLPNFFDLVIVATSANVRESVINRLIENHSLSFLILEKVLFQELDAYNRVQDLLFNKSIRTYVNHPRRMFDSYNKIKEGLRQDCHGVYSVVGGNWGLGCNALHFLDLFVYLSGRKIADINTSSISNELVKGSRNGFVEFVGTITGHLEDDIFFSITSLNNSSSAITATIFTNEKRYVIQEGGTPQVFQLDNNNLFKMNNYEFKVQFQSELTTNIAISLFENDECVLPTYEDAKLTHEIFIKGMLTKYNAITGTNSKILPIT